MFLTPREQVLHNYIIGKVFIYLVAPILSCSLFERIRAIFSQVSSNMSNLSIRVSEITYAIQMNSIKFILFNLINFAEVVL